MYFVTSTTAGLIARRWRILIQINEKYSTLKRTCKSQDWTTFAENRNPILNKILDLYQCASVCQLGILLLSFVAAVVALTVV